MGLSILQNRKIRVVHVISGLTTGGAERMLLKLIVGLNCGRYSHTVISLSGDGAVGKSMRAVGARVYSEDMRGSRIVPAVARVVGAIRREGADIIQGWMYHGSAMALIGRMMALKRIPVVWNIRQCLYDIRREKPMTARVIRACAVMSRFTDGVIYNSTVAARQHEDIGFSREKSRVMPNGFECDKYKPSGHARMALRSSLGLSEKEVVFGMVARLHPVKGYGCFIRAAGMIAKCNADVRFVMVGSGLEEGNRELAEMIRDAGVQDRVLLLGERADVENVYPAMDVFVNSSLSEGFSNAIGEAMSCGVPCVVSDVGESAKLVNGVGKVYKPADHDALAKACIELVRADRESRCALGMSARRRIVDNYSITAACNRYEEYYDGLLDCR